MKFKSLIIAAVAAALSFGQAFGQATILPPGETCFSALSPTSGGPGNTGTGFIGLLGTITGGTGYTNGTYGGVALTGGSGSNATANIVVSGGVVSQITILNPGLNYVVGDSLSAPAASIGGTGSGFSVPVSSLAINYALAGGTVGFYIPNSLSFKQTWQDAGQTILNQNPVPLDANGCAVIYGAGIYRQILKDAAGNTVWDKLTASTGGASPYWAAQAAGTPNAITVTDASFSGTDGQIIQFLALFANTGAATLQVSGGTIYPVVKDSSTGPAALSGGEIGPANVPMVTFDAVNQEFHLVNPASTSGGTTSTAGLVPPQGYLNLVGQASGNVVQTGDVIGTTTLYYSPFVGNTLPIWNGTVFRIVTFSELTSTLTGAGSPASAIQDACVFSNNGTPTLVLGPAWTSPTAGAGNRGTGAGTAQLTRLQGIWVNANQIVGYNGLSSYTIAANQCTYVGSVSIDSSAGQVSAYRSYGQSRKFGVWNAYNRQQITMLAGDPNASWVHVTTAVAGPSNGNSANSITVFTGLPEEPVSVAFTQNSTGSATGPSTTINSVWESGVGWNSTSSFAGQVAIFQARVDGTGVQIVSSQTSPANYVAPPAIGINVTTSLEAVLTLTTATVTYFGTQSHMLLTASYRG